MSACLQAQDECAQRPHYERYFYSDKIRKFPIPTKSRRADLIRTVIYCPATHSNILYMLQADCDFDKVTNPTFIVDGRISWEAIKAYLEKNHSYFFDYLSSVTESYSGRGLSLGFSISPMKLEEESYSCQRAAKGTLKKIYRALEIAGCGVDKGAFGLNRLCANWQNKKKSLYFREDIKNRIEWGRESALSHFLEKLNKDPLLAYKKKREQTDKYLWHHESTERGLAKLFDALFENDYTLQASIRELKKLTNISEATLRSVLNKPPKWLLTEWISKSEGWSLGLSQDHMWKFSARVQKLLSEEETPKKKKPQNNFNVVPLKRPEDIAQGERNLQLTNYLLRLKWMGIEHKTVIKRVLHLSSFIPNQMNSRNLGESRIKAKASCIYFSPTYQNTFGARPINQDYPEWLMEGYKPLSEGKKSNVIKNLEAPWRGRELPKKENRAQEKSYRKVSLDRHFKWKTQTWISKKGKKITDYCFYSVPCRPKKGVFVTKTGTLLRVFDAETGSYLCKHEEQRYEPNKYFTQEKHMEGLSLDWFVGLLGKDYPEKRTRWKALYKAGTWRTYRKILKEKREIDGLRKMKELRNEK